MFNKLFWIGARRRLNAFIRRHASIERGYIRHSAAFAPQDPFLADIDVAFFVKVSSFQELFLLRKQIVQNLTRENFFCPVFRDIIVLPASEKMYDLCQKYYPFRSVYPFETWRHPSESPASGDIKMGEKLPLDHAPENAFFHYLLPSILGKKKRRFREKAFLARRIKKDASQIGISLAPTGRSLFGFLLTEIELWSSFYDQLNYEETTHKPILKSGRKSGYRNLVSHWNSASGSLTDTGIISSVWAYPNWLTEDIPNVVINFKAGISTGEMEAIVRNSIRILQDRHCSLIFGSEKTMLGRINGLSRLNFLEPWLFQSYGVCLYGSPEIKERIIIPSVEMLHEKFKEIVFYFFQDLSHEPSFPYGFYQACYFMDHFLKTGELCIDPEDLARIYGTEFILPSFFKAEEHTQRLLAALEKMHGLSVF